MPSFAERIKIAIDTLRMKSTHDDGKVIPKMKSFSNSHDAVFLIILDMSWHSGNFFDPSINKSSQPSPMRGAMQWSSCSFKA